MWYDLLCNITISIVIVVILHYLYNYLKATYTTKKHRDVGRFHNDKYQAILQELKQREKATTQEVQVRMDEISNLVKANIELEQDKKAMERVTDMMKKEVEDALHYQVEAQQKLVEVRMQGLDFKSEIDRRVEKVMASIEGQMGYIPDAVEKQLFYVQILKVQILSIFLLTILLAINPTILNLFFLLIVVMLGMGMVGLGRVATRGSRL